MTMPSNTPASAVEAVIEKLERQVEVGLLGLGDDEGWLGSADCLKVIRTLAAALEPFALIGDAAGSAWGDETQVASLSHVVVLVKMLKLERFRAARRALAGRE